MVEATTTPEGTTLFELIREPDGSVLLERVSSGFALPLKGDGIVAMSISSVSGPAHAAAVIAGTRKPDVRQYAVTPDQARGYAGLLLHAADAVDPPPAKKN